MAGKLDSPHALSGELIGPSEHERFSWSEVVRGLLDLSTWLSATAYFGILAGLYSFGLFVSVQLSDKLPSS